MSRLTDDPEFTAEMLTMMGKELKQARQRIKDLEAFKEAYTANDVLSPDDEDRLRDFRERTDAAEEAMEIMHNHVQNVNKENQRLRLEVANLNCALDVKKDDIELPSAHPQREYREKGISAGIKDQDVMKNQVAELETALEKYYSKYIAAKKAKVALQEEIESLKSMNGTLTLKHRNAVARIDSLLGEIDLLVSRKTELETQLNMAKVQIDSLQAGYVPMANYRSLLPAITDIGNQVASTPPTSQPVCFLGVDLGAYLETDPRTARYSKNFLYSPNLLQFPDGTGRSALWLRPLFEFDGPSLAWTTRPPLGRDFTVFYPMNGRILYAGQYTVSQVFPRSPKDASYLITNKDPKDAKVIESITPTTATGGHPYGTQNAGFKQFYTGSVLQVGVVGLKFLSFDHQLHDILGQRFQASLPVERHKEFPNPNTVNSSSVGNKRGPSIDIDAKDVKRNKTRR